MASITRNISVHSLFLGLVLAGLFLPGNIHAAFEPGKWPCAYLARGSSGLAVADLQNGFLMNPALLGFQQHHNLSLFYRNYYAINGLNDFVLSSEFRFFKIPVGLSIGQFGDQSYHEQTLVLAAAWQFGQNITLGVALRLYLLRIKHYGQSTAPGSVIALQYRISNKLWFAAVAGNLNEPRLNGKHGAIPVYFTTGIAFKPQDNLSFSLDIFKDNRFAFDFRYGLGYKIATPVEILAGFRQNVHAVTAGIRILKTMVRFAYALEIHPDLGISNAIEVTYVF